MSYHRADAEALLSQFKHHEKEMKLKRRWLLGLVESKSQGKKFKTPKFLNNASLPESFLRKDDIFYETVTMFVEESFGARDVEKENHVEDDLKLLEMPKVRRIISSCLDNLTNKGLYQLATILNGGSVNFEKTCWKMKKYIRCLLSKVIGTRNCTCNGPQIIKQLSQLLSKPQYFQNKVTPLTLESRSYRGTAMKVLDGLGDLSSQTLAAMHRKLKGKQGFTVHLPHRKLAWGRDLLIMRVRNISEEMLSELDEGEDLQEPLAKAMAVANLSLKLTNGCHHVLPKEFFQFPPEVTSLQNEIIKAIWLVPMVKFSVLKNVHNLIIPTANVSKARSLRTSIKKMFIEFLFECSDMDEIPKSLLESLAIINRNYSSAARVFVQKEDIEEEVECILTVSAQTKQIVLDLLPDHDFDEDFADAYMEELKESDEDDVDFHQEEMLNECGRSPFVDSSFNEESIAECGSSLETCQTTFASEACSGNHFGDIDSSEIPHSERCERALAMDLNQYPEQGWNTFHTSMACENDVSLLSPSDKGLDGYPVAEHISREYNTGMQSLFKNQYLSIQDKCDETSMLAYKLIGHMLEEFAVADGFNLDWNQYLYLRGAKTLQDDLLTKEEQSSSKNDVGASAIVQAVKELTPPFPTSGMGKLKILLGLSKYN